MSKWIRISFVTLAALAAGLPASAGEVTGLTTFTPGTPAKASEVNGNFGIVAGAVNDNHSRLTAAETEIDAKQDRVTGTCGAGRAMSAVAANGNVTCAPLLTPGAVSVLGTAFVLSATTPAIECQLTHSPNWSFFLGSERSDGCHALAPVTLPHGALLTNLSCQVNDAYAEGDIRVLLYRRSLTSEAVEFLFDTPKSVDGGLQTIFDDSLGGGGVVDNTSIVYGLMAFFEPDFDEFFYDITVNLALVGCSVSYVVAP
jgi:hypothetical protein